MCSDTGSSMEAEERSMWWPKAALTAQLAGMGPSRGRCPGRSLAPTPHGHQHVMAELVTVK